VGVSKIRLRVRVVDSNYAHPFARLTGAISTTDMFHFDS
jgi:hypothetical protein